VQADENWAFLHLWLIGKAAQDRHSSRCVCHAAGWFRPRFMTYMYVIGLSEMQVCRWMANALVSKSGID
jgi:hypothetical protein